MSRILLFFIILISVGIVTNFNCGHKSGQSTYNFIDTNTENKRNLESSAYESIRIYADFSNLENNKAITSAMLAHWKLVLQQVIISFSNFVKVKRLTEKLKISSCSSTITVPNDIIQNGVDADLILFINANPGDNGSEAGATFCSQDKVNFRPIAGEVELNPTNLDISKKNALEYNTLLLMHEITHVLVLNSDLFSFYIDSDNKKIPIAKTISNDLVNGVKTTLLTTPKVVAAAKKHFKCDTLKGVELESQGGDGSAGGHFESRIMLGDLMIATSYGDIFLSEILLALYEDSGWYQVNYYTGGLFKFGKNAGCSFVNEKCVKDQTVVNSKYLCGKDNVARCMTGSKAKGKCTSNLDNSSIPVEYQYYENKTKGSYFPIADFCPVITAVNKEGYRFAGSCISGYSNAPPLMKETIGENSACFDTSLVAFTTAGEKGTTSRNSVCYDYRCVPETSSITLILGDVQISCPGQGGILKVEKFTGEVVCPEYNDLCTSSIQCAGLLDCIKKKSLRVEPISIKDSPNSKFVNTGIETKPIVGAQASSDTTATDSNTGFLSVVVSEADGIFDKIKNFLPANNLKECMLILILIANIIIL